MLSNFVFHLLGRLKLVYPLTEGSELLRIEGGNGSWVRHCVLTVVIGTTNSSVRANTRWVGTI
jgi:hypothetical protein